MPRSTSSATSSRPVHGRFDWPWRGGPTFVAPDGSQVSLGGAALSGGLDPGEVAPDSSGPDLTRPDLSRPWSASFVALVRGIRRSFTVAEAGAFEWHSAYTTVPDQVLRQPHRGGELAMGVQHDPAGYRAAWLGQWFELHTRSSGPPPPPSDGITRVFDAFRLTDTPLGLLVQPRSTRLARMEPVQVDKQLPGLGQLIIERPGTSLIELPRSPGHPTRHGELWRQPLGAEAQGRARPEALVLVTSTAITRLVAGSADSADPSHALAFLSNLNVSWERA